MESCQRQPLQFCILTGGDAYSALHSANACQAKACHNLTSLADIHLVLDVTIMQVAVVMAFPVLVFSPLACLFDSALVGTVAGGLAGQPEILSEKPPDAMP